MESVALILAGRAFHGEGATNLKALWPYRFVLASLAEEHQGETLTPIEESERGYTFGEGQAGRVV